MMSFAHSSQSTQNWKLHPLIHTLLGFNVTQDFVDAHDRDSKR